MSEREVHDLVGRPTDQGTYRTGKSFIPFYHGSDKHRMEAAYRGLGRLIYSSNSTFSADARWHLTWIIHNSNDSGYRQIEQLGVPRRLTLRVGRRVPACGWHCGAGLGRVRCGSIVVGSGLARELLPALFFLFGFLRQVPLAFFELVVGFCHEASF
jgi:hypothetical protein